MYPKYPVIIPIIAKNCQPRSVPLATSLIKLGIEIPNEEASINMASVGLSTDFNALIFGTILSEKILSPMEIRKSVNGSNVILS